MLMMMIMMRLMVPPCVWTMVGGGCGDDDNAVGTYAVVLV